MSVQIDALPAAAVIAWVRLRDELRAILGDDLVALWGYGARAWPDPPRARGDVDAWAVLARTPDVVVVQRIRRVHESLARELPLPLDAGYAVAGDGRPDSWRDPLRPGEPIEGWAFHRAHWLSGRYVHLHGKRPEDLLSAPTWAELARDIRSELEHLERHVAAGEDDPYEASYAMLNGARILYALETRDVVTSKRAAGTWAIERLDGRWHLAIRAAGRAYDGEETEEDAEALRAAMAPFVALVRERFHAGEGPARMGV